MQYLFLSLALLSSFSAPTFATSVSRNKASISNTKKKRVPAAPQPHKVFTFSCRDDGGEVDNVIGLAKISYNQKNRQESGAASVEIFFRDGAKGYRASQVIGHFDKVSNGWVLTLPGGPSDLNFFPDLRISQIAGFGKQACQFTGEMENP